jgi:hypothetical protein
MAQSLVMRPLFAAGLAALALTALPAAASAGSNPVTSAPDPYVLMAPVALPVVADGRLINYVFVTLRLGVARDADSYRLTALEPFFRDALVRAGHRTPFSRPDTYTALDDARLKQTVLRAAAAIAGPGQIVSVEIVREQAQHVEGLPKPGAKPDLD